MIILDLLKDTDWVATAGFIISVLSIITFIGSFIDKMRKRIIDEIIVNRDISTEGIKSIKGELREHTEEDNRRFTDVDHKTVSLHDTITRTEVKLDYYLKKLNDEKA